MTTLDLHEISELVTSYRECGYVGQDHADAMADALEACIAELKAE